MRVSEIIRAWGTILSGRRPALSIEVTRECPLRCPGCYAYDEQHLGGGTTLRQLKDSKGEDLINGVLEVVDRMKPLHLSLVGGDPLVRYREMDALLPKLIEDRGIHVQLVTSAFRRLEPRWARFRNLNIVVSIDGLAPDHDVRRAPATYEKILKNIAGQQVTVHCTITAQMMQREGYLEEFTSFWNANQDVKRIWFSIFTPQRGAELEEILSREQRQKVIRELLALRRVYPKIDMPDGMIEEFGHPPQSPEDCVFAMTTETISADLRTMITPCQFGGDPDCSQCGCIASMGLAAVGNHKLGGVLPVHYIFRASVKIGDLIAGTQDPPRAPEFPILRQ